MLTQGTPCEQTQQNAAPAYTDGCAPICERRKSRCLSLLDNGRAGYTAGMQTSKIPHLQTNVHDECSASVAPLSAAMNTGGTTGVCPARFERDKAAWVGRGHAVLAGKIGAIWAAIGVHLAAVYELCGRGWTGRVAEARMLDLRREELVRLTAESGVGEIEVTRGTIWVTETPAAGDAVLRAGARFRCSGRWPAILQATTDAKVVLHRRAPG